MNLDFASFFLAFIEGFALILSPCILPILPIILSASLIGGKKRPLGIILGFALTFAVFTLFSRFLVQHTSLNLNIVRDVAFGLIILFAITMLSDRLSERFSQWTQKLANVGLSSTAGQKSKGFFSGLLFGGLVSLIWTPCAGPILAAALIQIALQKSLLNSFIALFMFSLGSVIPMIIIAFAGRKMINKLGFLKSHSHLLRKIFAVIIIVITSALVYISYFHPEFFATLTSSKTPVIQHETQAIRNNGKLINGLASPYPAPALAGLTHWMNSSPLTLSALKGKVVLIDFWTYSCINCIRTLPYLIAWDKAYHNKGLYIIGIHTPEFAFEKDSANVSQAVSRFGIKYPVALDNDYATWLNYQNHYWPAHYLIDRNGQVVYEQFGEGDYDITEHNIQVLLGLNMPMSSSSLVNSEASMNYAQTPETYLGYARAEHFANSEAVKDKTAFYTFPKELAADEWALQGQWLINEEKITSQQASAAIEIHYNATHVYAVMGSIANAPVTIEVLLNGKPMPQELAGRDVQSGRLIVTQQRLYELVHLPAPGKGIITLVVHTPNVELYTFTFG